MDWGGGERCAVGEREMYCGLWEREEGEGDRACVGGTFTLRWESKNAKLAFWRSLEDNGLSSILATFRPRMENWEKWTSNLWRVEDIGNTDS
ncbi:hypothetical protein FH972_027145 [Carpinus fangiana]|uniref:Uncharacterized protein n=1 Tax=Carpinus fangiana TaxID=176857 RepID=A0A5N6L6E3_9ROSI|nr:hypothetical protein FH972_027145 [Carpinus fangiana]